MTRSYRSVLGLILAMAFIALSGSTLAAQNAATTMDNATAVALQKMQEQLDQQQQQIHRLQSELLEAHQQLNAVSKSSSSQPTLVDASYPEPSMAGTGAVAVAAAPEGPPPGPTVIPAIAPVRTLPIDSPKAGGLLGLKVGPVTFQPYGFIKATMERDSSAPDGDDFPWTFIFFNATSLNNTGATADPSFHIKARATRFGANVEWPDLSPKLTLTGRIEGDFEGNFNESDNSDVTSVRSPNPRLRLAFVRMDYRASENTSFYFEGGQDWTLIGSGALPNLLETTINGLWYGSLGNRLPQLRGGWIQSLSHNRNLKLATEFGVMMPSDGSIEKLGLDQSAVAGGLAVQLGQGERAGPDSGRPELAARLTLQFQLDQAKGVAPAQIMVSGFQGRRQYIPFGFDGGALTAPMIAAIRANPLSSQMYGGQVAVQLPTHWFTATASAYRGADLRVLGGGQINTFTTLACPAGTSTIALSTLDGGPEIVAGGAPNLCETEGGAFSTAPEKPIRAFGGFAQVGFPLSRLFNADPKGHNAGWQLYFNVGKDQVVRRDLTNPNFASNNIVAPLPMLMSKLAAVTLYYKVNQWASFGFEQSIYATRLAGNISGTIYPCDGGAGLGCYVIGGKVSNELQDHRTEVGPIFTF